MKYNSVNVKVSDHWDLLKDKGYLKDFSIPKYTNVWGEEILMTYDPEGIILNKNPLSGRVPGAEDFTENEGFYINNENGENVFLDANFKEYSRLKKKYNKLNSLKEKVNWEFALAGFYLKEGPNQSVTFNNTHIVPQCFWIIPQNEDDENMISKILVNSIKEYVNQNYEQFYMSEADLEKCIIQSICNLDISYLADLDQYAVYSYDYKEELITKFSQIFKNFLLKGITSLKVKPDKSFNYYPNINTFSFYNSETDEFMIRYRIGKDKKYYQSYIVDDSYNKTLPDLGSNVQ